MTIDLYFDPMLTLPMSIKLAHMIKVICLVPRSPRVKNGAKSKVHLRKKFILREDAGIKNDSCDILRLKWLSQSKSQSYKTSQKNVF